MTGLDISDTAIDFARQLALDSGILATFYRADLYDRLEDAAQREQHFDIAFCSNGATCWLSDLDAWAKGIAKILKPGGVNANFKRLMATSGAYYSLVCNDEMSTRMALRLN